MYKTHLVASLLLNYSSQDLLLQMPSLGFPKKKKISHIVNLHYYIYEEREIISKASLTTKEKSEIVTSKT
jgi:hypothetical protein